MLTAIRTKVIQANVTWILLALVGLVAGFAIIAPTGTFVSGFNAQTIALDSATLLVLASAATFVIISAGIDLSIGSVFTFAAVVSMLLMRSVSHEGISDPWLAIAIGAAAALGSGILWGAINGILIAYFRLPAFVVTLGSLGAALGAARLLAGGTSPSGGTPSQLQESIGFGTVAEIPVPFLIAVGVTLLLGLLLVLTRFGERTYMIGSNEEAVRRTGVDVARHQLLIYVMSGGAAGLAAFLAVARLDVASISSGHETELLAAIAAVVIGGASLYGGIGQMSGTVVGVYIPVVLANGLLIMGIERFWQEVAIGCILVLAVGFDQRRRRRATLAATHPGSDADGDEEQTGIDDAGRDPQPTRLSAE